MLSLLGGWSGFQIWQVRGHLVGAAALARQLGVDVLAGDRSRAGRTLAALQDHLRSARSGLRDPGWWLGEHTPYAGDNLTAVRSVVDSVNGLATTAFPALLRIDLTTLVPRSGRFDLAALRSASGSLAAADTAVDRARTTLAGIPAAHLRPELRAALTDLRQQVDQLAGFTGGATTAAQLLPALLGAKGPRTYLVTSQNQAELRATGGMLGAYAVLRVADGQVRLVTQGSSAEFNYFPYPVLPLSPEMRALYGRILGAFPADVNLTPHFPTAAALYREMYRRHTGTTVDGVLATDPVMLSYVLQATGPVAVAGQAALTPGSAVRTLLSDTYRRLTARRQDAYFAAAAVGVFDALLRRPVNPRALLTALSQAVQERRLLFWTAHPAEQRAVATTRLAGILPDTEAVPTVGVFLNDGSGAKLGYYLKPAVEASIGSCRPDRRREIRLRVTLSSAAPRSGLTRSVLGLGLAGDPYTVRTLVYVFSPVGGAVREGRLDGAPINLGSGTERRRQVAVATVETPPGGSRTLDLTLLTPVGSAGGPELFLTPTANPWTTRVGPASSCAQ